MSLNSKKKKEKKNVLIDKFRKTYKHFSSYHKNFLLMKPRVNFSMKKTDAPMVKRHAPFRLLLISYFSETGHFQLHCKPVKAPDSQEKKNVQNKLSLDFPYC